MVAGCAVEDGGTMSEFVYFLVWVRGDVARWKEFGTRTAARGAKTCHGGAIYRIPRDVFRAGANWTAGEIHAAGEWLEGVAWAKHHDPPPPP